MRNPFALPLCIAALTSVAVAHQDPVQRVGQDASADIGREQMWPAPTAEDWAKPCLITWQRTFEDAVAVSRETQKPLLVCVNMDGEIASEHYAGIRYRQPEVAALYEPYVNVIASTYRHNPRDYDEQGRRIICPRFGSVTCGEHIAIEPGLFDKFFEGQRVAPRHIAVELDSSEVYDVFYAFDTASVFDTIRKGIEDRTIVPQDISRGDLPITERVASRDIVDRMAGEQAYEEGDTEERRSLVRAALARKEVVQVDLLRLAMYDVELDLRQMAWQTLSMQVPENAVDIIAEALESPLDASDREGMIEALQALGESSHRARRLAVVHRGLADLSNTIDLGLWSEALAGTPAPDGPDLGDLQTRIEDRVQWSEERPDDITAQVALAEAYLELALQPGTDPKQARFLFEDARRTAREAEARGASGWGVNSVLALVARRGGDFAEMQTRVASAVGGMPSVASDWSAMATLELFADARRRSILRAERDGGVWPAEWLTDMHAAYAALRMHPLGRDDQVAEHHDFLRWLGARGYASQLLDEGIARFPDSWMLHERLRGRILEKRGLDRVDGLEGVYDAMLRDENAPSGLEWFAGYASLVTAEYHRRANTDQDAALAYGRAIAHYERAIEANPDARETADHYIALALAGRARLAFEAGDHERSLAELLAAFERRPQAAGSLDGLNMSAVSTAQMLLPQLVKKGLEEQAATLEAAVDALPPEALRLPAFEPGSGAGSRRGVGRRPRRNR